MILHDPAKIPACRNLELTQPKKKKKESTIVWFLSPFTRLCNVCHYLISEHFCHPQKNPYTVSSHSPLPPPAPGNHWPTFHLYGFAYSGHFLIDGVIHYVVLCIWLLSLSITFLGVIHVVACSWGLLKVMFLSLKKIYLLAVLYFWQFWIWVAAWGLSCPVHTGS